MDLIEGVGESRSPPRSFGSFSGNEVVNDVYNRLVEIGNEDATNHPEFRDELEAHFSRFPASYALDVNMDRVEDVLLHQKLLVLARNPENRLVFHVRLLEHFWTRGDVDDGDQQEITEGGFEPCFKLEDLNLEVRKSCDDKDGENLEGESSRRYCIYLYMRGINCHVMNICRVDIPVMPIHEVIFSALDKPKLLSQLSALLSDIDLNIREAHVFSTTDGYSLDVFVVDGWPFQETEALHEAMEKAIARSEGSWSGSSHSKSAVEKEADFVDAEIDRRLLNIGERIASGSCGDLFRGEYLGQDVAVKILRSEHLNQTLEDEFSHEVAMLREVHHSNIVRFIGACTKQPPLCIITEYMSGGSLYEYLHKNHNTLMLPQLVKFAIDVCKGMEYLHKNNIIHRDLKTANLLMDSQNVSIPRLIFQLLETSILSTAHVYI
ncbi:putative protein kinase TKL-Pl-4 family [Helianthus annuus]|nr:putative protein kinase TKL-Pl-4 family [Helianthus annuus]KAJ0618717.1 putative protein kinase TKL-Pl-4 family [Helianthus annuus]KAJ0777170.1 putative protein kinase TKL-Pl-4 family [Helianthus annuus]KAJ0951732.1 putative protein kinase TKL-Pl-4 family [Helianthus annuus]